jgi:hypothetical protein
MMDFTKKDEVMNKIRENGTLMEMLVMYQQLALQYAQMVNPMLGQQVANMILQQSGQPAPQQVGGGGMIDLDGGGEHPYNERAREQARASTQAD